MVSNIENTTETQETITSLINSSGTDNFTTIHATTEVITSEMTTSSSPSSFVRRYSGSNTTTRSPATTATIKYLRNYQKINLKTTAKLSEDFLISDTHSTTSTSHVFDNRLFSEHTANQSKHVFLRSSPAVPSFDSQQTIIVVGLSVAAIFIVVSLVVLLYCKLKRRRQNNSSVMQHQGLELSRRLPQVPDVQTGAGAIYDQIDNTEHYYSEITDHRRIEEAAPNGAVATAAVAENPQTLAVSPVPKPKFDGYVTNATCVEHDSLS